MISSSISARPFARRPTLCARVSLGALASEQVVLEVTFADTPFEEGVRVVAQVLGCAALTGLGDAVHRRHDLPSRQLADAEIEMILETVSQRRHCRFPVDDLACRPALILTRPLGGTGHAEGPVPRLYPEIFGVQQAVHLTTKTLIFLTLWWARQGSNL